MLWSVGLATVYVFLFVSLYFQVFMLVSFIETRRRPRAVSKHAHTPDDDLPKVAIIVPCFNEELTVGATIASLQKLDYPADKLEIIVVDDGSTDGTLLTAEGYTSDSRVHVFHKENGGKHTAMNFALARTDAAFIGCLDADSVVAPEALRHIVPIFIENEKVAAVTPGILIKKPETMLQHMQHAEYSLSVFNRYTLAALGSAFITPGPFSIFRTSVVREADGWRHGHSTEDLEMALRIQQKGYLIANAPAATVHTGTPTNVRALIRQRVRWTYGFLRNAIDYRHMFGSGEFGNLGLIILPMALASIGIAIFFFLRILYYIVEEIIHFFVRYEILGFSFRPSFDTFYVNTSMLWFLIYVAVALVIVLIAFGVGLGTGKRGLPKGTPLFVFFYSFLVPVWLTMAVIRAIFKTGVRWR